jgi:hypothetical protein
MVASALLSSGLTITLSAMSEPARTVTLNADNGFTAALAPGYFQAREQVRITATGGLNVVPQVISMAATAKLTTTPEGWTSAASGSLNAAQGQDLRAGKLQLAWQSVGEGQMEVVYFSAHRPDFSGETFTATCRIPLTDGAFTLPPALADADNQSYNEASLRVATIVEREDALVSGEIPVVLRTERLVAELYPPSR